MSNELSSNRILLVTLQGNNNYGNRLQNYALQELIKENGYSVDTLVLLDKQQIFEKCKHILKRIKRLEYYKLYKERRRDWSFNNFTKRYIDKRIFKTYARLFDKSLNNKYTFAVVGSDQVWHNWSNTTEELMYYYLCFVDKHKRISYAASFGFERMPFEYIELSKEVFNNFSNLSCREKTGCQIVKDICGREPKLVLDPTLCYEVDKWKNLEKKPRMIGDSKYIFVHVLGKSNYIFNEIKESKYKDYLIVNPNDRNDCYFSISPNEYLWLIDNAEFVYTDSFHATVFSILFHKRFKVFERDQEKHRDMFDRIKTLLVNLDLYETDFIDMNSEDLDNVYKSCDSKLKTIKEDSLSYLKYAIKK